MPTSNGRDDSNSYGLAVGFIYVFNLIVGSGALTMPKAFGTTGIILSPVLLVFLTLMSFVTATFMFESMAIANAICRYQKFETDRRRKRHTYGNAALDLTDTDETAAADYPSLHISRSPDSRNTLAADLLDATITSGNEDRPLMDEGRRSTTAHSHVQGVTSGTGVRRSSSGMEICERIFDNNIDGRGDHEDNDDDDEEAKYTESTEFANRTAAERRKFDKLFDIRVKFEMGEMAAMFFSKTGQFLFYVAMILYLYGDLAIYDAAVPKSLRDTTCTFAPATDANVTLQESDPCWPGVGSLSRMNVYRIYVALFNATIGVLVFYDVQKTKLLQLLTTAMRWLAFGAMIALAIRRIATGPGAGKPAVDVPLLNVQYVPNFFGVCIYAFMCHHSLPSIVTPMRRKDRYRLLLAVDYACIMLFYLLLSVTGVLAFGATGLNDFYTLNFLPTRANSPDGQQSLALTVVDYYLSLFPVFTISASFPIIGITLRNNLKSLMRFVSSVQSGGDGGGDQQPTVGAEQPEPLSSRRRRYFVSIGLPLITLVPPALIALVTHDLQLLVGVTGSYAGVAIQYVIPSCLVYFGRRAAINVFRANFQARHSFASPFRHKHWVFFVLLWSNVSVIFVTVNHIVNKA